MSQPSLAVRPILVGPMSSWEDVRLAFAYQLQQLQQHIAANWNPNNAGGSRISGVGSPQQMDDAVNLGYLHSVLLPNVYNQVQSGGTTTSIIGTGNSVDIVWNVPVGTATIGGTAVHTAQPNLFNGNVQVVTLTTNVIILAPLHATPINSTWRLVTRQDSTGGWSAILNTGYAYNGQVAGGPSSPASTQCVSMWGQRAFGSSGLIAAPVIDQPIP